jgi:hypothetical protein
MQNPLSLANIKAFTIMALIAAAIAAVAPSIKITLESNSASACDSNDSGCDL